MEQYKVKLTSQARYQVMEIISISKKNFLILKL